MMNDNSVVVTFSADAGAVGPGVEQVKSEISGLEPTLVMLTEQMAKLTDQMAMVGNSGAKMGTGIKAGMAEAEAGTNAETSALVRMIEKVHEGAESVRTFQMRAKEFAEVYVAMFAVEGVKRWAESMGEAAEKLRNLSTELGISVPELQQLQGVADQTGVPMDTISKAVGLLDRNLFNSAGKTTLQANAFKSLGISANDGRTNMEKLAVIADKLKDMDDGPKKAALAFAVFGRSGLAMIPVLEKGSAGLEELNRKTREYGVVNDDAQAKSLALAESTNESKLAFAGFSNVMASSFAPLLKSATDSLNSMIKSFVQSYQEGGTAKVIMDALSGAVRVLGVALEVVGAIIQPFGAAIKFVADNIEIIAPLAAALAVLIAGPYVVALTSAAIATIAQTDAMVALQGAFMLDGFVSACTYAIELFAGGLKAATISTWEFTTALLANPLTWVAVAAAAAAAGLVWLAMHTDTVKDAFIVMKDVALMALEWIKSSVMALGSAVVTMGKLAFEAMTFQWGSIASTWQAGLDDLAGRVKNFDDKIKVLHDDMMKHLDFSSGGSKAPKPPAMPKMPGSFDPELGASHKEKKPKGAKDDLVQKLNEELEAKKTAWAMAQDAQGTAEAYSLESEAAYWKANLARHDLSAKDRMAIEQKYLAVRGQLNKQQWALEEDHYKDEVSLVEKNEAAKLALAQKHLAVVGRMFGLESTEYAKAKHDIVDLERKAQAQLKELAEMRAAEVDKRKLDEITAADEVAKFRVSMGQETDKQLLVEERAHQIQSYNIEREGLERRMALVDPTKDPVQYQKLTDQIEQLERTHQAKLTKIDQAAYAERTKMMRGAIDTMSKSFGDHISKMITLQEGWRAGLVGIYQSLVGVVATAIQDMITKWMVLHLTKLLMGKGEATAEAAKAGAGGVASMAAAPFPLNLGAPAFGASMFSAAMGFAAVPGYDVGAWNLSKDHLAMVHSGEMIIPASLAGGMRALMTAAGGSGSSAGGGGGNKTSTSSSDATFHYSPVINHSAMDLKEAISRDSRDMRKWFINQVRNGALRPAMT